jgi:hypothetical protein
MLGEAGKFVSAKEATRTRPIQEDRKYKSKIYAEVQSGSGLFASFRLGKIATQQSSLKREPRSSHALMTLCIGFRRPSANLSHERE